MSNKLLMCALAGLLLAGCGGGGSFDPTDGPPESANASSSGMTFYLGQLIAADADTLEPFSTDGFNPPTPDNTEAETLS